MEVMMPNIRTAWSKTVILSVWQMTEENEVVSVWSNTFKGSYRYSTTNQYKLSWVLFVDFHWLEPLQYSLGCTLTYQYPCVLGRKCPTYDLIWIKQISCAPQLSSDLVEPPYGLAEMGSFPERKSVNIQFMTHKCLMFDSEGKKRSADPCNRHLS